MAYTYSFIQKRTVNGAVIRDICKSLVVGYNTYET